MMAHEARRLELDSGMDGATPLHCGNGCCASRD